MVGTYGLAERGDVWVQIGVRHRGRMGKARGKEGVWERRNVGGVGKRKRAGKFIKGLGGADHECDVKFREGRRLSMEGKKMGGEKSRGSGGPGSILSRQ